MHRRALVSLLPVLLACRTVTEPEELGSDSSDGGNGDGESGSGTTVRRSEAAAVEEDAWNDCYALEPGEGLGAKLPIPG